MIESKTIGELMIPLDKYPHVKDTCTLREAIIEMRRFQIVNHDGRRSSPRDLLVFDQADVLVGTLRRRDILRGLEPTFMVSDKPYYKEKLFDVEVDANLFKLSYDKVLDEMQKRAEERVTKVMIPLISVVNSGDHLLKAIKEIVDNNCSILPVLDKDEIVGVIRTIDVMNEIAIFLKIEDDNAQE